MRELGQALLPRSFLLLVELVDTGESLQLKLLSNEVTPETTLGEVTLPGVDPGAKTHSRVIRSMTGWRHRTSPVQTRATIRITSRIRPEQRSNPTGGTILSIGVPPTRFRFG